MGRVLSVVDVTDLSGISLRLTHVRIVASIAQNLEPQPSVQGSSIPWAPGDLSPKESVTFEYGALEIITPTEGTSLPDWVTRLRGGARHKRAG